MPQVFHVVCCYKCSFFQVHIVKKIPKWECKICGEKQSVKKVFANGTGKDCRLVVQQLNTHQIGRNNQVSGTNDDDSTSEQQMSTKIVPKQTSKWNEFLVENSEKSCTTEKKEDPPQVQPFEQPTSKWNQFLPSSNSDGGKTCKRKHEDSNDTNITPFCTNKKKGTNPNTFESDEYDLDLLINS